MVSLINENQDMGSDTLLNLGNPAFGFFPWYVGSGNFCYKYEGILNGGYS